MLTSFSAKALSDRRAHLFIPTDAERALYATKDPVENRIEPVPAAANNMSVAKEVAAAAAAFSKQDHQKEGGYAHKTEIVKEQVKLPAQNILAFPVLYIMKALQCRELNVLAPTST